MSMISAKAATFGSRYERWRRKHVESPVWFPQRFMALSPPTPAEIKNAFEKNDVSGPCRRATTAANIAAIHEWLPEKYWLDFEVGGKLDHSDCPCCRAYGNKSAEDHGHRMTASSHLHAPDTKELPGSLILFDHDTWVTTVKETVTFPLHESKGWDQWARVKHFGNPRNWAEASRAISGDEGAFFRQSTPGLWGPDGFHDQNPDEAVKAWRGTDGGQLREETEWNWNFTEKSKAIIILNIVNYRDAVDDSERDQKDDKLSFEYSLHHCESYEVGPIPYRDVLDVDGGHFEAYVKGNSVTVSATKRLHFSSPRADPDLGVFLNLLAPATTSLLLHELVYDGTVAALQSVFQPRATAALGKMSSGMELVGVGVKAAPTHRAMEQIRYGHRPGPQLRDRIKE